METLSNGAILLLECFTDIKVFEDTDNVRRESIVLAATERDFVTWSRWKTYSKSSEIIADDCEWGHYFDKTHDGLTAAMKDYDWRLANRGQSVYSD